MREECEGEGLFEGPDHSGPGAGIEGVRERWGRGCRGGCSGGRGGWMRGGRGWVFIVPREGGEGAGKKEVR